MTGRAAEGVELQAEGWRAAEGAELRAELRVAAGWVKATVAAATA